MRAVLTFLALAFTLTATAQSEAPVADMILKNARIFTDHPEGRWAEALSARGGLIQSIGTWKALEKEKGPLTKVVDLGGKTVLPAFNDAHAHMAEGGLFLSRVDLNGVKTVAQLQERVRSYAAANPDKRWVLGQGWDHTAFPGQTFPTREDIDAAVSDRPVMLWHADHHILVMNTKGLDAMRIDADTPDPEKGRGKILRDEHREPTGVFLEDAATQIGMKIDKPSHDELVQAFRLAQDQALRYGVTSIQGGPMFHGESELKILAQMNESKQLHVRVSLWGDLEKPQEFLALKERHKRIPEERIRFGAVKGFVDGVISARTAAMAEPYSDSPSESGEPAYTQERLNELVLAANRLGLPVALHAIGDRAVAMAVNAFANARKVLFNSRLRNRIEHVETAQPGIYARFTDFKLIASMQPSHLVYDDESENYNDARLGKERVKHAFAVKSFLKAGAQVAFGTDWPVMPLNPMIGLFAATQRQHYNGKPSRGWQPDQKISMEQAVEAYTLGSAYASHEEHVKGSIHEGKYADLVVLNQNPFRASGTAILKNSVHMTISGGQIVFDGTLPRIEPAKP